MNLDPLKAIVGNDGWLDDPADMQPFLTEWRDRYRGRSPLILLPASTGEVRSILMHCAAHAIPVVPQGGNTGLCGGAIPDQSGSQVVLSMRRMHQVRELLAEDFSITVDAGCTLSQVQRAAADTGLFFPLSLAAEGSCQIGGNLSTNAGGINVLRYGTARQQVLGLEVVLANGDVLHGLRSLRKDTAGYDLKQLFIGAEGTLGIITGACLRLQPDPGETQTVMFAIETADAAVKLLSDLRAQLGDCLLAFELVPDRAMRFVTRHIAGTRNPFADASAWYALVTAAVAGQSVEQAAWQVIESGRATDAVLAKNQGEADALWKIRHSISEAQKPEGASLKHDVSVPIARVGEFIAEAERQILAILPNARLVAFGHVGDGNVHLNVSQPLSGSADEFLLQRDRIARLVYDIVSRYGGSFSAEHGVGQARRDYLQAYRSTQELRLMRLLKETLDPGGILNPGKVI